MDLVFILINSMALFFGLGSLCLGIFLAVKKQPLVLWFCFAHGIMLVRHGVYILRVAASLPTQNLPILLQVNFLLLPLLLVIVAKFLSLWARRPFPRSFKLVLISASILFLYASLELWLPLPKAPVFLAGLAGYGSLFFFATWALIQKRGYSGLCIVTMAFSLIMFIDDLYIVSGIQQYGFFSFPLFLLAWNSISILLMASGLLNQSRQPKEESLDRLKEKYNLTSRELDVIQLLAQGHSYQAIADKLFVSLATVKTHSFNAYKKLGISNKMQLIPLMRNP